MDAHPGNDGEIVRIADGMLVPVLALPDQPRLEVPESVVAAQPVHDLAVPHTSTFPHRD
jgi:hypothetical protein